MRYFIGPMAYLSQAAHRACHDSSSSYSDPVDPYRKVRA